ncbi:MAG: hypothetical protein M0Z89_03910, partial [Nitrospiraceae bacterium]|nr:hypothetical protein [Nitrospiraceae bacterium]
MGETQVFQPLTREDKITVLLYRIGIVLSAIIISALAILVTTASASAAAGVSLATDILAYCLYISVGMSVFFIHLYVGVFKRYLKNLYFISLGCLAVLLFIG